MTTKVTFVNKHNEDQTFKVNLFGPNKNCVKVSNVLTIFKAIVAIMFDNHGFNMDCFDSGSRHVITLIPALDLNNFLSKIFINLSFLFLVQSLSLNIKFA
jgi:preprotein translocase subunit SecG